MSGRSSTSTNAVNRGYWDPEESTRTKWTTTYATELQERGLSQDFTGLSELLLGQAQPAQFQSAEQTGYWWGSKVSDDGEWTELDTAVNNSNAVMPRSYHEGNDTYGDCFNWYAATAESDPYINIGAAADSICPSGWQLPADSDDSAISKTWLNVLFNAYELSDNNTDSMRATAKIPLLIPLTGYYRRTTGNLNGRSNASSIYFWTSSAYGTGVYSSRYLAIEKENSTRDGRIYTSGYTRATGFSVRCVKK